jgi:hypothetical protein
LDYGFEIKGFPIFSDECTIIQKIERLQDSAGLWNTVNNEFNCVSDENKLYIVKNSFDVNVTENPDNGFIINHQFKNSDDNILINDYLDSFFRKLRLLKDGNPHICIEYRYFKNDDDFQIALRRRWNLSEFGYFFIEDHELKEWNDELINLKFPISFEKDFLQLAFDNYELSYYTFNYNIQFLLLMISLEVLFKYKNNKISHKIPKNVASFIANDEKTLKENYNKIYRFYQMRSEIVHGGDYKTISNDIKLSIKELREYVRDSILKIEKRGKDKEQFIKSLQDRYLQDFSKVDLYSERKIYIRK